MLVLTRRIGESIIINGDIRVTVVTVMGGRVRVGITAPPAIKVDREEILQRKGQYRAVKVSEEPTAQTAGA
jgi:carbon storage regulator